MNEIIMFVRSGQIKIYAPQEIYAPKLIIHLSRPGLL